MRKEFSWNEEASAGSLVGTIICIIVGGLVFWTLGAAVDRIIGVTNTLMGVLSLSQDAANTIYNLSLVFTFLPFMYLFILIVNYIVTSSDEASGGV